MTTGMHRRLSARPYAPAPMLLLPSGASLSIVFPAYQEEQYLAAAVTEVVMGVRQWSVPFQVVVVENGSRDATMAVATDLAERFAEVVAMSTGTADYGRALRAGLLASNGTYVVNFDVDLYDLAFVESAIAVMTGPAGASIVVGSKRADDASDNRHWTRKVVTAVFSGLLRHGFGLKVSDTHGMKVMRRADVVALAEQCLFGTDLFDTELVLRAERAGLRTGEVGVTVAETRPARTPIVSRIWRSLRGLARLRLALWSEARRARRSPV